MDFFTMDEKLLQGMLLKSAQQEPLDHLIKGLESTYGSDAVNRDTVEDYLLNPEQATSLDARQRFMITDKLLEKLEVSIRMYCDLLRYKLLWEAGIVETMDDFLHMFHSENED